MSKDKYLENEKVFNAMGIFAILGTMCSIIGLPLAIYALGVSSKVIILGIMGFGLLCISYIGYILVTNHFLYLKEIYSKVKTIDNVVQANDELKSVLNNICEKFEAEIVEHFTIINRTSKTANIVILVNCKVIRNLEFKISCKHIEIFEFSKISLPEAHRFGEIEMKKLPKIVTNGELFVCCPITTHVGLNIGLLEIKPKNGGEENTTTNELFFSLFDLDNQKPLMPDKKYTI